ncbi:MAG: YdcH family protein [Roseovarius sp.]
MPNKKISPDRLMARIATLRRRHQDIDMRVENEQSRAAPDTVKLRQLKQERLGLKDAIHVTHAMLVRATARQSELA